MRQLETSSFQSASFSRCTGFPCKSDCASIENRSTLTILPVHPTERVEHAIGPLTSGLRHEHGRRHVGGHVGRSLFPCRHPSPVHGVHSNFGTPSGRKKIPGVGGTLLSPASPVPCNFAKLLCRIGGISVCAQVAIGPRIDALSLLLSLRRQSARNKASRNVRNSTIVTYISTRTAVLTHHHPSIVSLNGISI